MDNIDLTDANGAFCYSNNMIIDKCVVKGSITESRGSNDGNGWSYLGGITGVNDGEISNCLSDVVITAYNYNYGVYCGGIVASNNGTITNCYSIGQINGFSYMYRTYVGGIAGISSDNSQIENCFTNAILVSESKYSGYMYLGEIVSNNNYKNCFLSEEKIITDKNNRKITCNSLPYLNSLYIWISENWNDEDWILSFESLPSIKFN